MMRQFLSAKGRLSRGGFWLQSALLWGLFYALWEGLAIPVNGWTTWLINAPVVWVLVCLCARRLHDRHYSGWWLAVVVVPVGGALWLLWQLACRQGDAQSNRWGPNPQAQHGDFLTVQ